MIQALRAAFIAFLFAASALAAEVKPYVNEDMASDAVRLAATLKAEAGKIGAEAQGKTPDDLRKSAGAAVAAGKFDVAAKLAAAAVTAAPKDPANWLTYAIVAIKADDAQANNRWDLVTQGAAAAYAAYQRAGPPADQAVALSLLGDLLARHSAWRGALDAYKASLDRRDNIDVRKTYEAMRAQYGFRILDYKVDNEFDQSARLLHLLRAAGAQDRFRPLCRRVGRLEHRDLERGPADLRRRPEARRALRHRAARGAALGGRREPFEVGRLRDLRARPLAPGPFRRPRLCAAARGAGRRAARHRQHRQGRHRRLPHRRPQPARRPSTATISSSPSTRRRPSRSPTRTASRCGAGRWTWPARSTRTW